MKRTQKLSWLFAFVLFFGSSTQTFSQTLQEFFSNTSTPLTYMGGQCFRHTEPPLQQHERCGGNGNG